MTSNLGSKWLQYIYCLISQEVSPNIFLEKSFKKSAEETSPRPLYKKSLLSISLDQQSEILYSFLFYVQFKDYQNILKLRCWPLAFTSYKALLLKKTNTSETSLRGLLSAWVLMKNISRISLSLLLDILTICVL